MHPEPLQKFYVGMAEFNQDGIDDKYHGKGTRYESKEISVIAFENLQLVRQVDSC